ncbi:hypothetical protein D3C87_182740 [compost metagenome]
MMQLHSKIHKKYFRTTYHTKKPKKHVKNEILALKNIFYEKIIKNFTKNHKKSYF